MIEWNSIRHKEIVFRDDHGNVKFTQTRPESVKAFETESDTEST